MLATIPSLNLYPNGRFGMTPQATGTWSVSGDQITLTSDGRNAVFEALFEGRSKATSTNVRGHYRAPEGVITLPWSGLSLSNEGRITFHRAGPPSQGSPAVATDHQANLNRSLYSMALSGQAKEVKKLLSLGADPNVLHPDSKPDDDGRSPSVLHVATLSGSVETAQSLLNAGARLEAQDPNGSTPLHYSCAAGNLPLVRLLILRGALRTARNDKGQTPLDLAILEGRSEVEKLLGGKPSAEARHTFEAGRKAARFLSPPARYNDRKKNPLPVKVSPVTPTNTSRPNATVRLEGEQPTVFVDAGLIQTYPPTVLDFVVLHETGHYLAGHIDYPPYLRATRWDYEFDADAFAQAVFVGWDRERDLSAVLRWMQKLPGESDTHPSGLERLEAIQKRIETFSGHSSKGLHEVEIVERSIHVPNSGMRSTAQLRTTFRNKGSERLTVGFRGSAQVLRGRKWATIDAKIDSLTLQPGESKDFTQTIVWPTGFGFKLRLVKPSLSDGSVWIAKRG